MISYVKERIVQNRNLILFILVWLCIWGGYSTDVGRFFVPGFPHGTLDLIHGLRSFLPFFALAISIIVLFKNHLLSRKIILTPLGLFGIFTVFGLFSSVFSKNPILAFYWGVLYGTVIVMLLTVVNDKHCLKNIIKVNWLIGGVLAVGLAVFFLIQPGAIKSITFNFLICSQRPYEGLAGIPAGIDTFGITGTRPTGLGRYAGVMAVVSLASLLFVKNKTNKKVFLSLFFIVFLMILLFSKGKTEIISFLVSACFIFWLVKKFSIRKIGVPLILTIFFVSVLSIFVIFYNIPCSNAGSNFLSFFLPNKNNLSYNNIVTKPNIIKTPALVSDASKKVFRDKVVTLSGRTTIWQDAWNLFRKNPLFGYGFLADRIMLDGRNAQNSLIHALLEAGILGTIPFILVSVLVYLFLVRLFRNKNIEIKERNFLIMISAILLFFVISSATESVVVYQPDWLFIAPIIAYIQCLENEANNKGKAEGKYLNFLGNKISAITAGEVVEKMSNWIKNEPQKIHWLVGKDMHGAVEAERRVDFNYILKSVDLFLPDGISLLWLLRLNGFDVKKRVSGVDLMPEFFRVAEKKGFSSYFYGDTEETLKILKQKLLEKFPNLKIAGSYSPPFRNLTEEEDCKILERINQAKPDVLWVGLGVPKQEKWIYDHKEKLNVPVVMGVGAAFKFLSGGIKRAPSWIGSMGFEWLWRFFQEPKRMWKRVFIDMPFFIWLAFLELTGLKSYK